MAVKDEEAGAAWVTLGATVEMITIPTPVHPQSNR